METISINELVALLTAEGYRVSRRTIWFYIEKGILPKPITTRDKRGGVKGMYPVESLNGIRRMLQWRDSGASLKELTPKLLAQVFAEVMTLFAKHNYGLNDHKILLQEFRIGYQYGKYGFDVGQFEDMDTMAMKDLNKRMGEIAVKTAWLSHRDREREVLRAILMLRKTIAVQTDRQMHHDQALCNEIKQRCEEAFSETQIARLSATFEDVLKERRSDVHRYWQACREVESLLNEKYPN